MLDSKLLQCKTWRLYSHTPRTLHIHQEGLELAYDGVLRPNHADELRDHLHDPEKKVEIVFFLDAYDELPPSALWKNLWRTNNLQQFRMRADGNDKPEEHARGAEEEKQEAESADIQADLSSTHLPKVLITVRSELLSGRPDYQNSFLPIESQDNEKDEAREVRASDARTRTAYAHAHVQIIAHADTDTDTHIGAKILPRTSICSVWRKARAFPEPVCCIELARLLWTRDSPQDAQTACSLVSQT